jgi:hypothetical protein
LHYEDLARIDRKATPITEFVLASREALLAEAEAAV